MTRKSTTTEEVTNEIESFIRETVETYDVPSTGLAHLFGEMRAHISAMGGSFPDLPFNLEPNKIPVKNGVLNFKFEENRGSVELLPHGPENYFTFVLNAEYKPEIGTESAMAFLSKWVPNPGRSIWFKRPPKHSSRCRRRQA